MKTLELLGGVYIPIASGLTKLYEIHELINTGQLLISQAMPATLATLFMKIRPRAKSFTLHEIKIGYVDGANINDLAQVTLLRGPVAGDEQQQRKIIWQSGALAETPLTAAGHHFILDPPRKVNLDEQGKLYFATTWTTTVISCGAAGEYFYLEIWGEVAVGCI